MINKHPLILRFLLFVIFPLVLLLLFLFFHLKSSVTPVSGRIVISGLDKPVNITHDKYGTPSIVAATDHDAFFALGFKHASDRLWQLEMQRRVSQGRLSEILGADTLHMDIWMRTLGLHQAAKQSIKYLNNDTIKILSAYRDGINAWTKQADVLPPEFQILGIKPEPWTIYDTLSWQKMFSMELGGNMFDEMRRYLLQAKLTPEQMKYFYPNDPADSYANAMMPVESALIADSNTMKLFSIGHKFTGSNAWVVSGKYTKSGHAILANDPHLGLQLPSLWYAASLKGHKLNVSGMTLVGLPIVIFGQNSDIAWGGTNLTSDQQDLFIETISPNHLNQYLDGSEWKRFEIHHEKIKISANFPSLLREPIKPIDIMIRRTERGPIISDARNINDEVISLRWAALDPEDRTIESFIQLQYAKNWDDFRQALTPLKSPGLNFVYADREGNIGYQAAGMMPKRGRGIGIFPQLASKESQWQGYHEFSTLPSAFNPGKGFFVTANEKVAHSSEIIISHDWAISARHERITSLLDQLITKKELITVDQMRAIQTDRTDVSVLPLLAFYRNFQGETAQEKSALAELASWSGEFNSESVGATLFTTWSYYLEKEIFDDVLKSSWQRPGMQDLLSSSMDAITWPQLAQVLTTNSHGWCKEDQVQPCRLELQASLSKTLKQLEKISGTKSVSKWHWGSLQRTEFLHHPFGRAKGLESLFKRTTHAAASPNSINASNAEFDPIDGFTQNFGAGFRQIFELNASNSHWYMVSTGQAGNIMSSHFDDMILPFANGQLELRSDLNSMSQVLNLTPAVGKQ